MRFQGLAAGVEGRVDQKFDLELRGAAGGAVRASRDPKNLQPLVASV